MTSESFRSQGAEALSEATELLASVPSLASLPRDDLSYLASAARRRSYAKGEVIFHRDDPGDSLHIISAGEVRVVLPSPEGEDVTLALLGPGDFFGELSLLDGGGRSATTVAAKATETLVVQRDRFLQWLSSRPAAATAMLAALGRRLRAADELVGELAFLDVHCRLARKLLDLAGPVADEGELELHFSQDELASMVGVTRESVNKHLRFFRRQGVIEVHRRRIVLRSVDYLRSLA
jgi:CRP/FNR family cyclic AMP-dependent transcriptional regulator